MREPILSKEAVVGLLTLAVLLVAIVMVAAFAKPAHAATYYWANTYVSNTSPSKVTVRYCSGGTETLWPNDRRTKDVCGVLLTYNSRVIAKASPSGTMLVDKINCGDTKWLRFTSVSDTSKTAIVSRRKANCA